MLYGKMLMVWDGVLGILKTCYLGSIQGGREPGESRGEAMRSTMSVTLYSDPIRQ